MGDAREVCDGGCVTDGGVRASTVRVRACVCSGRETVRWVDKRRTRAETRRRCRNR